MTPHDFLAEYVVRREALLAAATGRPWTWIHEHISPPNAALIVALVNDADADLVFVKGALVRHGVYTVWDECECPDPQADDGRHVDMDEAGLTCKPLYQACLNCCTENGYQIEQCADSHDHTKAQCPELVALATAKGWTE